MSNKRYSFFIIFFLLPILCFSDIPQDFVITFPVHAFYSGISDDVKIQSNLKPDETVLIPLQFFGVVYTNEKITLSWTGAMHLLLGRVYDTNTEFFTLGFTTGLGMFFPLWKSYSAHFVPENKGLVSRWEYLPLTGPCVFFYPVYNWAPIRYGVSENRHWKIAADIGVNYSCHIADIFAFVRPVLVLGAENAKILFDMGIAFGLAIQ